MKIIKLSQSFSKDGEEIDITVNFLRQEKNGFLVYRFTAFTNGKEVGYLDLLWIPSSFSPIDPKLKKWVDNPEVGMVKVIPEYRRKGVATNLYRYVDNWLESEFQLSLNASDLITPDGKKFRETI